MTMFLSNVSEYPNVSAHDRFIGSVSVLTSGIDLPQYHKGIKKIITNVYNLSKEKRFPPHVCEFIIEVYCETCNYCNTIIEEWRDLTVDGHIELLSQLITEYIKTHDIIKNKLIDEHITYDKTNIYLHGVVYS